MAAVTVSPNITAACYLGGHQPFKEDKMIMKLRNLIEFAVDLEK
jgi:hypothetical protein